MNIKIKHAHCCNEIGQRENNEDSIFPRPNELNEQSRLFIVCDGVGGFEQGEVASECVSAALAEYWYEHHEEDDTEKKIHQALHFAVNKLSAISEEKQKNAMSTTLTLASVGESAILIAHVGDSRIYHVRPKEGILSKTKDHTYIQSWIDAGILTEEEAKTHPKKNIILRAIAPYPDEHPAPDVALLTDIQDGDYLFMCTDGILESINDKKLLHILTQDSDDEKKMNQIAQLCQESSRDNYSAYLLNLGVDENDSSNALDDDRKKCSPTSMVEKNQLARTKHHLSETDIELRHQVRERNRIKLDITNLEDESDLYDSNQQEKWEINTPPPLKLLVLLALFFSILVSSIFILVNFMRDEPISPEQTVAAPDNNTVRPTPQKQEPSTTTIQREEKPAPNAQPSRPKAAIPTRRPQPKEKVTASEDEEIRSENSTQHFYIQHF